MTDLTSILTTDPIGRKRLEYLRKAATAYALQEALPLITQELHHELADMRGLTSLLRDSDATTEQWQQQLTAILDQQQRIQAMLDYAFTDVYVRRIEQWCEVAEQAELPWHHIATPEDVTSSLRWQPRLVRLHDTVAATALDIALRIIAQELSDLNALVALLVQVLRDLPADQRTLVSPRLYAVQTCINEVIEHVLLGLFRLRLDFHLKLVGKGGVARYRLDDDLLQVVSDLRSPISAILSDLAMLHLAGQSPTPASDLRPAIAASHERLQAAVYHNLLSTIYLSRLAPMRNLDRLDTPYDLAAMLRVVAGETVAARRDRLGQLVATLPLDVAFRVTLEELKRYATLIAPLVTHLLDGTLLPDQHALALDEVRNALLDLLESINSLLMDIFWRRLDFRPHVFLE